jgi:uncharacterized repeat protein (TIGR01451 family)
MASAAGTRAGTTVTNNVSVDWMAGTAAYSGTTSAALTVDNYVAMFATNNGSASNTVLAGDTGSVLFFRVVNSGNSTVDLNVSAVNVSAGVFSTYTLWHDSDSNGVGGADVQYAVGGSTIPNFPTDITWDFFVTADILNGAPELTENVDVLFQAFSGAAILATENSAVFSTLTAQNVMNDAAGSAVVDFANDARHSARGSWVKVTAVLTASKSFTVTDSRPFNTGNHAIPGATISYRIVLLNSGNGNATGVSLTDTISSDVTMAAGTLNQSAGTPAWNVGPRTVIWSLSGIAAGQSEWLTYDVTITP